MKDEDSFSKQIDDVISGKYNRFDALKVCETPQIFIDAGLQQLPILYTQNHLKDALHEKSADNPHWHGLSIKQIKKVPKLLESPVLLMDSLNNDDSIVAVLSLLDNDNAPVFATIKPNGNGIFNSHKTDSNFMLSIYGKEKGFEHYIKRAVQENKILYWNKEKSQEIQCAELLMAQGLDSLDSNKILHQTNSLVNKTTSTLVIDSNQAARIKAAREIKENMPNLSENERTAAIAILEAGAKSQGMEFSEYVEKTFPDGIFGDIKKAENAAKQQGVNINGAVSVNGFGENVKAVIYAGKTADFSTWCHELSHIWQAQLAGELKQNAEEAFQVKSSDWQNSIYTFEDGHTDTSAEAFAYGFEDFLKNKAGEMAAEDKKKIFEKFADYMSRTYNGIKQHIEINEKIASVYQKFVEFDDNILAQAEKAVQMEIEQEQKINEIFNSPNFKTSQKVSETIGLVSDKFAALASQYRYDIKGYSHTIDNFFVNHALKQHGDKEAEEKRGNVAITYSDICNIFSVYTHPDYIVFGTKTKTGNPAIVYVKNIGDSTIFVEDVRSGKKELAAQTLYKKSGTIDVSSKKEAPELYAHSDPESISIVDVKKEFVNESKNEFLQREKKIAQVESFQTHSPGNQNNSTDAKNANISFQPVDDSYTLFQSAYHGSSANFDKFNTSEYGLSGDGAMAFGYGVYVSNSETIARSYAGIQGERNLYTVEIPDGDYIIWNKTVSKLQKEKVKNELYENLIKEDYKGVEKQISTELNNVFSEEFDGKKLYGTISSYIGSDKETSRFFKNIGYSGIQYPAGTPENAVNYVIFDDNDIKIKNHFQFQIIGELGARELDRNAESNERIANLETAKRMEEAEKDANVIRLATGWEKGADGKWKYEIDDSKVHFNLYDAMEEWDEMHPRYEELREKLFKTELSEEEQKEFDQWVDERNEVSDKHTDMDFSEKLFGKTFRLPEVMRHNELFKAYPELKYVTVSIKKTGENGTLGNASYEDKHINLYRHEKDTDGFEEWEKKAGSVLLHEVQHIIQGIESFAKGASPEMFEESPEASEQSNALAGKIVADGKSFMSAMEAYRASAGEVESRNVQTRMRFTPKQRINTLLSDTADIAPKDQIVMFDVPTSESRDIKNTNEERSVALKADSKENKMGIISATMKSATKDFTIYGNKEKIQVLAEQQRTNLAEVHSKEAAANAVLDENGNTHYQTDEKLLQEYKQKYPESSLSISEDTRNELENVFSQIDDYLDKGIVPQERRFTLPKVSSYLKQLGSDETAISLPVSVIKKARETHGLSNEEIKNSLTRLYDPVAVFDTDKTKSENKLDSKLILTDEFSESKPIALALNTNTQIQVEENGHRKFIEVQDIRSIHDRTLTAKNGTDLVKHWTENGLCRYVDDKKISEWSTVARVSFPIEALHSDKNNILTKSEVVNPQNSGSVKQEEERTMKSTENFESQEYWKNQFQQDNAETFKAIDDYLEKGIRPKNDEFIFEKVPEILKAANVSENEIVIKTSIINKAKNEHSLSDEEIKDSIKNIASPVLVFNSDKTTTENKKESFLCLTDTFAENGKPIAFSMNLDSDYEKSRSILNVNQITSIHDRTLIAKNGTDLIQKWTENGLCRYVDDKKISEWSKAAGVQFPLAVLQSDKTNILSESNIVNGKKISERQLATGEQFPLAVLHSDRNNILSESDFVNDKKISEWQLAARVQFPLAVLHSDINNINLSPEIVNGTDYQEIRTFSEFAEQQKAMEKEYQEYLGTISPDEESSRRIDSGEIFGKLENQQSKEELNVATYKFQSGETLDEIIQGNSDFSTETALLDNLIDNSIREVYEYATNEEKSVLRQFAAFRNDYDTDMKNLAVQTDCISRWIAAEHWNPEKQEFQEEYVNQSAIKDFPYKLPWEMKEIEDKVLKTENEIFDNGIESIQVNGGMSEAAIEAEIRSQEKDHHEVEEYNDGQLPLQVVAHTDFNYFNSDKISFKEYIVRTDASVVQDLIEKNADSFNKTNSKLEENAIPCIIVRKSVNPEIPDQFLLSKYENNNLNKDEIAKQAGKFASKEIKIENTELITQIKNVIDWNDKQNKTQAAIPELKIYHTLKEDDVKNLEVISDQEFSDIVDSIILNDYKNIPNAIRLPNLNEQLSEKLGLEKDSAFILKKNATHIRPDRKGGYGQAFDAEEYRRIPEILRNADFAVVDTVFQNFQIVFDDKNDGTKINKLVFNKDELGNYLVTLGKVDRESAFSEERNPIVAVGVAPTIQTLRTSVSSTALRASTTMGNETISQVAEKSINEQKIKMPDQLVYAAAKVGQVIEQRTQEAQSIVNPTRDDRLSTISVPLNKEYNENFALSTVEKLLETEKNAQKATAADFQQIEPALQKKFDKLKAAIKSREEQDIQDISAAEEPGNKKQAIRSKSDIIRQAGKDFLKSVKEGIAPFFNAEDDFQRIIMHPQAIINASNGLPFSGESQLLAQIYHQRQRMEGEVVTSIAGAKAAGTIVLDTPESRQKNFALTDTSSLAEKNAIVRTRYFMPESCEEPDKIYAHTLQRQRPDKIRSYRDLIRHFENIPNGQKEISDIRIRIAHEHLKEIQSRFAIKEKRVLSVDEIEERKNFLRNYFERLPADYRNSERSAFEDTFGIQLNSEKNLEINLQRDFKDIDFAELKKNTKKSIELENRKLSDFIEKNTMEDKKLATLLSDEYKSLSKEEKMTVRNLKIEAIGIKEPETFLGKYLAACNTNAEFITDKETVEEVKKNLVKKLEENFKLEKYDILKEIGQQAQSIGNETTKKISFEKAHSNNKSLEKTQSPDKEISLIGMGK